MADKPSERASAEDAALQGVREDLDGPFKAYNIDLKARLRNPATPAQRMNAPAPLRAPPRVAVGHISADVRSAGACVPPAAATPGVSAWLPGAQRA